LYSVIPYSACACLLSHAGTARTFLDVARNAHVPSGYLECGVSFGSGRIGVGCWANVAVDIPDYPAHKADTVGEVVKLADGHAVARIDGYLHITRRGRNFEGPEIS